MFLVFFLSGIPLDPDMLGTGPDNVFGEVSENVGFAITFGGVMIFAILLPTLARVMVFHRLARAVVNSLAITGTRNFAQVAQALDSSPRLGEGLADAFDLGDF
jgi:hypothetical protein